MKKLKIKLEKMTHLPYIIFILYIIKLITYYVLIEANPIANAYILITFMMFGCIFMGLALCRVTHRKVIFLLIYSLLSILMFADSMYYNYYNQTVSIKQLWQAKNVASVPDSFVATLIPASFLLLIDIPFVYYIFTQFINQNYNEPANKFRKHMKSFIGGISIIILLIAINPLNSVVFAKVNSVEFFTNHISDVFDALTEDITSETITEEEVLEIIEELEPESIDEQKVKYQGVGEGKNLIIVQLESLQNFVINTEYNNQELTPNLNNLIDKDSLYFNQYYSHIGKGNTVDAEFSTLNSLYPAIERESYTLYEEKTFYGLPWILRDEGYKAIAFHGYKGEFWNRENAYPGQGFEEFYSMEDLDDSEIIGMGISDKTFLPQSVEIMEKVDESFFSFIVTLTNHHPYLLDEKLCNIDLLEEHEGTKFGSYLQTVKYTDEAIGEFIEDLKEKDLYDDSIIVFYGDHHGLNYKMDNNMEIVSEFIGKDYDFDEMLKVPLIIHIPDSGMKETIATTGGLIDFLPTIANIMNLEIPHPYVLGQDLINANEGFVAFTSYLLDGSFIHDDIMLEISREQILEGSRVWNINTHETLDPLLYEEDYNNALTIKKTSEEILEQDLISEYKP